MLLVGDLFAFPILAFALVLMRFTLLGFYATNGPVDVLVVPGIALELGYFIGHILLCLSEIVLVLFTSSYKRLGRVQAGVPNIFEEVKGKVLLAKVHCVTDGVTCRLHARLLGLIAFSLLLQQYEGGTTVPVVLGL